MSEAAVVASRKARLHQAAQEGDLKAAAALELAESPNRFLATVQFGITLIGILSGAFGGATISKSIATQLRSVSVVAPYADGIAFGIVVAVITYLSLVLGELAPKRLALHSPERIAGMMAGPMRSLSTIATPFVWLLSFSTDLLLRLVGLKPSQDAPVTEEEIKVMIAHGTEHGVFASAEKEMVERVFRLGDRNVASLMTRRPDIVWLNVEDPWEENRRIITENVYSRLPLCCGGLDDVIGVVRSRELLAQCIDGRSIDLMAALHPSVLVPESLPALKLLESLKSGRTHIAFVIDEHGGTLGLVTLHDILGAIVGDLPTVDESDEPDAVQREDGSWLLDAMMPIEDFKTIFDLGRLPDHTATYSTLSGFIMAHLGQVPKTGQSFDAAGLRFEILDMDGNRIDKVLVNRSPP